MIAFLSILAGASCVGMIYLLSRNSQIRQPRSRRGHDAGASGTDVHGSSGSGGSDFGADGGCD